MNITEITKRSKAFPKRRRVGRGEGSGLGKTSGRGHKGCGARAGWGMGSGMYEGGMFPLFRRIPKVGFNNFHFRTAYQVVNLGDLEKRCAAGGHVTAASLFEMGLIGDAKLPVKVLGDGELKKKLTIEAHRASKSAVEKIKASGGTLVLLGPQPKKKFIKRPAAAKAAGEGEGEKGGKPDKIAKGAKVEGGGKKKGKGESADAGGEKPAAE